MGWQKALHGLLICQPCNHEMHRCSTQGSRALGFSGLLNTGTTLSMLDFLENLHCRLPNGFSYFPELMLHGTKSSAVMIITCRNTNLPAHCLKCCPRGRSGWQSQLVAP